MIPFLPYLALRNPGTGQCFDLFNNCQTMAAVNRRPGWDTLTHLASCDNCCPSCDNIRPNGEEFFGIPSEDGAWWYDASGPNADEALGFLIKSVELEEQTSARRLGESSEERPVFTPRTLEIRGRMLADSEGGVHHLRDKLKGLLSAGVCEACDGWEATLRAFCPDLSDPTSTLVPVEEAPPLPDSLLVDWTIQPRDCANPSPCPDAPGLDPVGLVPTRTDDGLRTVLDVRFQYFEADQDVDEEEAIASCYGQDFVILFEVWEDYEYGTPIPNVGTNRLLVFQNVEQCEPHDWRHCLFFPDLDTCQAGPQSTSSTTEPVRPSTGDRVNYCQPLLFNRQAELLPQLPTGDSVAVVFEIQTGSSPLSNFRLDVHAAYDNVPSPETCAGNEFYRSHAACGRILVAGPIPASSRLVIDGRRRRTLLYCGNGDPIPADDLIEGWNFPALDPACRHWVTTIADCINTGPEASASVTYAPRF